VGRSLGPTITNARWRIGHARPSGAGRIPAVSRAPAATAPKPTRRKITLAVTALATLTLTAAACGGSTASNNSSSTTTSLNSGVQALNPGSGSPQRGGTLNVLGTGDVDFMDYNISYYSIGYLGQRQWVRGLYAYPAIPGKVTTAAPDLATATPVISNGGKTYAVTIRSGADWNTTPARQVTAADALRGLERACNPVQPFGGLPDFESLIVGYAGFCEKFGALGSTATAAQMKSFLDNPSNTISGVTVSGQTITFNLTQPASYFADELTLPAFNPAPVESLNYVPASADSQQHTIADGPYQVSSYVPTKSITFTRNPAWKASSDPIRHAYVDQINVNETGNQTANQTTLQTNTAAAGAEFDSFPPTASVPGLVAQMQHGSKNFNLGPTYSTNPYVVFDTVSPNNSGALGNVKVRQAISYAINRAHLIQDVNGSTLSPPLTHILPDGINGSQDVPSGYDPYPYDQAKAKAMLKSAGYSSGLTLKFLFRPSSSISSKVFQTLQADLAPVGIKLVGVGVPSADFYTKYLIVPSVAKSGAWDVSLAGWGPDWYGDAATSFFKPLFYGAPSYPPNGSNFGFYNNPAVSSLITKAASQGSASAAASLWAQADQMVMKDAPVYPITQPLQALYHASYVHNAVYVPAMQQFDFTNVWLSSPTG
jgi:peptide/nickel transport system substrate-binding protein